MVLLKYPCKCDKKNKNKAIQEHLYTNRGALFMHIKTKNIFMPKGGKEKEMENRFISGLCYELYKNDWMKRISPQQKADLLKNWYQETECENRGVFTPENFLDEVGYDGNFFVCFEEFLENEYLNKKNMKELLDNDELYAEYEADLSYACNKDCTKVTDSMQLSSETTVCSMKYKGHTATIEVRGDVKIAYNPDGIGNGADSIYHDYSEMPEELKRLIDNGTYVCDERVYKDENNWFEVFYLDHSDTLDCEYHTPEELKEQLFEYVLEVERSEKEIAQKDMGRMAC